MSVMIMLPSKRTALRRSSLKDGAPESQTTHTNLHHRLPPEQDGKTISKPIYNHVNGTLDTPETIEPTPIVIVEGLHPMYDERVRDLLDFSLYLDISDEVKFAWKIQRDMEERGHSLESIQASIEARKPDFDAYIAPQKEFSDLTIQVLPTEVRKGVSSLRVDTSVRNVAAASLDTISDLLQMTPSSRFASLVHSFSPMIPRRSASA